MLAETNLQKFKNESCISCRTECFLNWFSTKHPHIIIATSLEKLDPWTTIKPQSIGVCVCLFVCVCVLSICSICMILNFGGKLNDSCVCWFAQALPLISYVTLGQSFHHLELLTEVVLHFAGENLWETM